jgi:uncharacterized protein YrrD
MPDPVSWLMIERGWDVVDRDGNEIGKVEETVGDSNADIFDGLTVNIGFLKKGRYVPAERVAEIVEGQVRLAVSGEEAERLVEFEEPPPSERIVEP